jgi:hypothetical protein
LATLLVVGDSAVMEAFLVSDLVAGVVAFNSAFLLGDFSSVAFKILF